MQGEETHAHATATAAAPAIRSRLIVNENVEELIDEVEKRPALYKKDMKQYSDINVKKKLWEEVCAIVVNNWSELNANEKREMGREVQKKWNNLRTCFSRELKAQKSLKSGQSASKRQPYVYFERMLFLVPCMESRPTEGSIETSESNQNDTDLSEEAQPHRQRKRKAKQGDFEEQLLNALQSNDDDDTNYCLSLVPFMKELTGDEKLEARIHILKIFQDLKKKRQFQNISFQPDTSESQVNRRATPSTSIQIVSDQIIKSKHSRSSRPLLNITNQTLTSQPLTASQVSQQQYNFKESTYPLTSPSPESQSTTPPPQYDSNIVQYWSNYSESDSELIDIL